MSKVFRPWRIDEIWLLPPSVADFVPSDHPAHLVRDLVCEELDLSAIMAAYTEARGYPPYHPGMMVALLLYAYRSGFIRRAGLPVPVRSGATRRMRRKIMRGRPVEFKWAFARFDGGSKAVMRSAYVRGNMAAGPDGFREQHPNTVRHIICR